MWRRRAAATAARWRARRPARSGGEARRGIVTRRDDDSRSRGGRLWAGLDSGRTGGFQCGTVGLPLPVGDSTDFGKGYSQLEFPRSLCSTCSCAPRVFRRASQGPQGRVVPFGGARQGPDRRLRTAVQQRRPGRVPRFVGAYSSSPVNRTFVSGCEGSRHRGIA